MRLAPFARQTIGRAQSRLRKGSHETRNVSARTVHLQTHQVFSARRAGTLPRHGIVSDGFLDGPRLGTTADRSRLHDAARNRSAAVEKAIDEDCDVLSSIRNYFLVSGKATHEEFHELIKPFHNNVSGIQAIEWIPRVPAAKRRL